MKKLMPIIAAGAILLGSACNTYTSTTDPADYGSGSGLDNNQQTSGHTNSKAVAETNNNATFDNATVTASKDSVAAIQPQPDSGQAPANSATPQTTQNKQ